MKASEEVLIYGAGMAGMIAAINLAKDGYKVTVNEAEAGYGGASIFNPSTHVTPIDLKATGEYIGIDISSAFHPLRECNLYIHDLKIPFPVEGVYSVERGDRDGSLDSLLYKKCLDYGVKISFNEPLRKKDIANLPPNTIIACGLLPSVYEMFEIPYKRNYCWVSRGFIGFSDYAWVWIDESITEYGYISSVNNYYFNLLFSVKPVGLDSLRKYEAFMRRNEGIEHLKWEKIEGAVPVAERNNPSLFRGEHIMCGTMSGMIDPFMWFGILGACVSGKIAAIAYCDREEALREFHRFIRRFAAAQVLKEKVWSKIRPHVKIQEAAASAVGPQRISRAIEAVYKSGIKTPIPGFCIGGCF